MGWIFAKLLRKFLRYLCLPSLKVLVIFVVIIPRNFSKLRFIGVRSCFSQILRFLSWYFVVEAKLIFIYQQPLNLFCCLWKILYHHLPDDIRYLNQHEVFLLKKFILYLTMTEQQKYFNYFDWNELVCRLLMIKLINQGLMHQNHLCDVLSSCWY